MNPFNPATRLSPESRLQRTFDIRDGIRDHFLDSQEVSRQHRGAYLQPSIETAPEVPGAVHKREVIRVAPSGSEPPHAFTANHSKNPLYREQPPQHPTPDFGGRFVSVVPNYDKQWVVPPVQRKASVSNSGGRQSGQSEFYVETFSGGKRSVTPHRLGSQPMSREATMADLSRFSRERSFHGPSGPPVRQSTESSALSSLGATPKMSPTPRNTSHRDSSIRSAEREPRFPPLALTNNYPPMLPGPILRDRDTILGFWFANATARSWTAGDLQLLKALSITVCKGRAAGRYVLWETHNNFWQVIKLDANADRVERATASRPKNDLWVEYHNGGPFSGVFRNLVDHPNRCAPSLLIQERGPLNEIPCEQCCERFAASDGKLNSGTFPFFGCRSIPGEYHGSCACCVWYAAGSLCSFRDDHSEAKKTAFLRARWSRRPPLVSELSLQNSPAMSREMSFTGRELVQELSQARSSSRS